MVRSNLLFAVLIKFGDMFYDTHTIKPPPCFFVVSMYLGHQLSAFDDYYLFDLALIYKENNISIRKQRGANFVAKQSDKKRIKIHFCFHLKYSHRSISTLELMFAVSIEQHAMVMGFFFFDRPFTVTYVSFIRHSRPLEI